MVKLNLPWNAKELKVFKHLTTPRKIQDFLDEIPYSTEDVYRSPRSVIHDRKAHCFDGCLFGAAALRFLGFPPLIVDMIAHNDDEHMLAIFKVNGSIGAIAKSNFTGLRYREPIYKSLRELVMSYFEDFYNLVYEKTLRGYTIPLNLAKLDHLNWMTCDEHLEEVAISTDKLRRYNLLTKKQIAFLSKMDEKAYKAGMLGAESRGLFKPGK